MWPVLVACGAFLSAVLWMDLMFDVQVLRYRSADEVPDAVLASIAAYYRRVTTDAWPMGRAVGVVMVIAAVSLLVQLVRAPGWIAVASLVLAGGPLLIVPRVLRNAVRLGARADSPAQQTVLARAVCRDHLICLGGMAAFVALQILAGGN
jgi:hypothetical protein